MSRQILKRAPLPQGRCEMKAEIVLVFLTHNTTHPYVTWQRNVEEDSTYWGHYFETREKAEADFTERCVRLRAGEVVDG